MHKGNIKPIAFLDIPKDARIKLCNVILRCT